MRSMGWVKLRDVNFLSLQTAVFCVQCELLSENSTTTCLACGSQAVLNLSRILGGSLRRQPTANLIADAELDRLVRELLQSVPTLTPVNENRALASFATLAPRRNHARAMLTSPAPASVHPEISTGDFDLEPAMSVITERAQALTGATGAAIALRRGAEIVCRARAGRTAPDLGVRLQTESGISADCVRTGEVILCHDAEDNPHVDLASARRLGARSILAAPLRHFRQTLGVLEVLSSVPHAFGSRDVATMQMLSSMIVAAISRLCSLQQAAQRRIA
jgi:GAF domain-containing protein